jgi:MFS superfamily sulfate permease-like transporter
VALSIGNVFRHLWWPYQTTLGRVPNLAGFHDVSSYPRAELLPGCIIFRFDAPLFFANARTFREQLQSLARTEPRPAWIVVAAEPITDIDSTAADMLEDLDQSLNEQGTRLVFAEMKDPVRRKVERYGLAFTLDPAHFYPTLDEAVGAFRKESGSWWTTATSPDQHG